MSITKYEFMDVPGLKNAKVPIIRRSAIDGDEDGTKLPDWMVYIDGAGTSSFVEGNSKIGKPLTEFIELFGWYCESSRGVTRDSGNNLYTSGTLWHSTVYLVIQNGAHNAYIKNAIADGTITPNLNIVRLSRVGTGAPEVIQSLLFQSCHWNNVQSHLDLSIVSFTACIRSNTVFEFKQMSGVGGQNSCSVDYTTNQVM